ncbi:methylated-DNA--[protein]-cysteine S-methyltransferase [Fictibacillus barbaricus]|uniref:Methylated-DNA--protein-cysteine methyltransferase n=1 Tax=Fictibacillus barbaricus TaxID=182136 RepID=A0ABU1TW57_9BACL|nr:methylated-DNA--[protein]-cysteine S-methyltransferase [Fictibacillus barbaricus]MDR7071422.1 methylated-DNA-[protein]-cysteine S-methyltransferase [Fictibacillus barbaricus]
MNKTYKLNYDSPIGTLALVSNDDAVISIMFNDQNEDVSVPEVVPQVLRNCYEQIHEYFKGKRQEFTFPYLLKGTPFQEMVWNALIDISYGQTVSYQDIANVIKNEKAIRAVGNANGKNKLSIVIPCHRIIGSNGKLTGYAGGLWRKEWLLKHEKNFVVKNKTV